VWSSPPAAFPNRSRAVRGDHGEFFRQPRGDLVPETCENGLPCISSTGGPLPPCTVTMRAPPVWISVR